MTTNADTLESLLREARALLSSYRIQHGISKDDDGMLLVRIDDYIATGGWIDCKDRLPTKDDADADGYLLQCWDGLTHSVIAHYTQVIRAFNELDKLPGHRWQPLPSLPKEPK